MTPGSSFPSNPLRPGTMTGVAPGNACDLPTTIAATAPNSKADRQNGCILHPRSYGESCSVELSSAAPAPDDATAAEFRRSPLKSDSPQSEAGLAQDSK